jgi:hypothetical protein
VIDDRLHAERRPCAAQGEVEDTAHHRGLVLVDGESLLELHAPFLKDNRFVAIRWVRPVPESLAGVLLHGPQLVLGVLAALIFVEAAKDLTDQVPGRVVLEFLRHRDQHERGDAGAPGDRQEERVRIPYDER